jgi:hypothetical protein
LLQRHRFLPVVLEYVIAKWEYLEKYQKCPPDADVGFYIGVEPDFVIEIGLLEDGGAYWSRGRRLTLTPLSVTETIAP